jgi:DNA-binding transcriptional ArsR family regulator
MVRYSTLDRTFAALSDPTRRDILDRLAEGPATLGELARPFDMTLPGLMKHVRVLEEARLVVTEKKGRTRECRLGSEQLDDAAEWIETHRRRWERRLDRLGGYLERQKGAPRRATSYGWSASTTPPWRSSSTPSPTPLCRRSCTPTRPTGS